MNNLDIEWECFCPKLKIQGQVDIITKQNLKKSLERWIQNATCVGGMLQSLEGFIRKGSPPISLFETHYHLAYIWFRVLIQKGQVVNKESLNPEFGNTVSNKVPCK